MRARIFSFLMVVMFCSGVVAQDLQQQYSDLKENSGDYQDYKVIKEVALDQFWNTTVDSINLQKSRSEELESTIETLQSTINDLTSNNEAKAQEIEDLQLQTDSIDVLGITFSKGTFKVITFGIIILLVLALLLGMYRYRENASIAKRKSTDYEKLSEDFEAYKKNSLEKQMKLRRELQTERNKLQEVRNN